MSISSKLDNIVHHNLGKIITTNGDFKKGISNLKNSGNFYAICRTADRLLNASSAYHKYLYGNPLPSSIAEIGVGRQNFFSKELTNEMDWLILSLRKYRAELNFFVTYKKIFEDSFLLGHYEEAALAVDNLVRDTGNSIWAINAKILLHEYQHEQDKAKLLMTEVLRDNRDGLFTSSLVNFISQRSERKLSAYKYDTDLKNALNNLKTNLSSSNKEYYNFQLNFFEKHDYFELNDILGFDFRNPICDRYLTFRKIAFYMFCSGNNIDEIVGRLPYIIQKIDDPFFDSILFFLGHKQLRKDYFDEDYLRIIDLFYAGFYEDVIKEVPNILLKQPSSFTLVNLYSRALIFLGRPYGNPLTKACVLNEIAENIYRIYKRNSIPNESLYGLYQVSKNLDGFDINFQLNSFIKNEQNIKYNPNYFYFSLPKADPKFLELFNEDAEKAGRAATRMIENTYNSIAVTYKLDAIKGNYENSNAVCEQKALVDKAGWLFREKRYDDSLELFKDIFNKNANVPPVYESAISYIFNILFEKGELDAAIKWYVDSFIKNPYAIFKVRTDEVHKVLKKHRFKNVSINIYLAIFISVIATDENEKSFVIELFCKANDALLPSDLIDSEVCKKDEYFETFLNRTCSNETLKHYRHIATTKKRLEERIRICDFLARNYEENRPLHVQELDLLTNELIIYEGTTKLDDSKIYANDNAILNNELKEFEGLYNRYTTIAGLYLKNVKILTINKNELRYLNKKNETEYSQNDVEYSNQAYLDAFYTLFDDIRERFLFSKFGIVTYLSTRIRHGVLLGELRPELENYKLIFFKNKLKNSYEIDNYWMKDSDLNEGEKQRLAEIIIRFSDKIDEFIDRLIKNHIQIKLNNQYDEGWFDYDFNYEELSEYAITLFYEKDYKEFCKKILELLWIRTDQNLEKIRLQLQGEVKSNLVTIFNEFESELHELPGHHKLPKIFTALNSCSTSLQNKMGKISSWFKRSGKTHSDFIIEPLINIICSSVTKSHPLKRLNLNLNSEVSFVFKGEYYEHFKDFLRIVFDNMLRHSIRNNINCSVRVEVNAGLMEIIMENDYPNPDSDLPVLQDDREGEVNRIELITEGKSGLVKAIKTIKTDLKDENNKLVVERLDNKFVVRVFINYNHLVS